MANLREWFLALAVVVLLSLGSAPASAATPNPAFVCNANAGVPPLVRSEGITELMGDLILNCTGGNPTVAGGPVPLSNVQIFLNTNVTSRSVGTGSLLEATLMIDEPLPPLAARVPDNTVFNPPPGVRPPVQVLCTPQGNPCPIVGDGFGTPYETIPGTPTVYSGRQAAVGSVSWNGVPIDAPGTANTRVIRITNVRANACQLGTSSTLIPTQIVMFISVTGSQQVTINNPQQTVGFIQSGLIVGGTTGSGQQCASQNTPLIAGGVDSSPGHNGPNFNITLREGFASSFKRRNISLAAAPDGNVFPAPRPQNIPGYPYNTESGFYNPALTPGVGLADFGTRIRITFNNIGAGVTFFVPTLVYLSTGNTTSTPPQPPSPVPGGITVGRLVLVRDQVDPFGSPSVIPVAATGVSGGVPVAPVNAPGATGPGYATYEVVNSDVNAIETATVAVSVAFLANTEANLPAVGQTTSNVTFAPAGVTADANTNGIVPAGCELVFTLLNGGGVTPGNCAALVNPIPRFCNHSTAVNVFVINLCPTCNLLFPYVSNQSGFNTVIAIANTSVGPGPPFNTLTQPGGKVTLYYFGGVQPGDGDAPQPKTTLGTGAKAGTVPAGCELVFTLSSGGAVTNCTALAKTAKSRTNIAAAPGFEGFIIAVADFPSCQGFAAIGDKGMVNVAEGYLAIPLNTLDRTGVFGENKAH